MTVAVIGNDAAFAECKARLGEGHQYHHSQRFQSSLSQADVVFDFSEEHSRESVEFYGKQSETVVFLNTVFTTLSQVLDGQSTQASIVGFCGLPTFFNREILEVAIPNNLHRARLDAVAQALNLKYVVVKDQVGFVTPRVVCMIINEAFDALKSAVASREDIDLSMKLGTNYPFGPFEWSERIGLENVRKLLSSVEIATGDVRYRPMF